MSLQPRKPKRAPSVGSRRTQEPDHASKNDQYVDALVGIMVTCGALFPPGMLEASWRGGDSELRDAYRRRAIAKCESSEHVTLSRAVTTWHEICEYLESLPAS